MNKERRKQIEEASALLDQAKEILEACKDEEQEYYDNMPESFQNGEKGERAQSAIDALDTAMNSVEEATGELGNIE